MFKLSTTQVPIMLSKYYETIQRQYIFTTTSRFISHSIQILSPPQLPIVSKSNGLIQTGISSCMKIKTGRYSRELIHQQQRLLISTQPLTPSKNFLVSTTATVKKSNTHPIHLLTTKTCRQFSNQVNNNTASNHPEQPKFHRLPRPGAVSKQSTTSSHGDKPFLPDKSPQDPNDTVTPEQIQKATKWLKFRKRVIQIVIVGLIAQSALQAYGFWLGRNARYVRSFRHLETTPKDIQPGVLFSKYQFFPSDTIATLFTMLDPQQTNYVSKSAYQMGLYGYDLTRFTVPLNISLENDSDLEISRNVQAVQRYCFVSLAIISKHLAFLNYVFSTRDPEQAMPKILHLIKDDASNNVDINGIQSPSPSSPSSPPSQQNQWKPSQQNQLPLDFLNDYFKLPSSMERYHNVIYESFYPLLVDDPTSGFIQWYDRYEEENQLKQGFDNFCINVVYPCGSLQDVLEFNAMDMSKHDEDNPDNNNNNNNQFKWLFDVIMSPFSVKGNAKTRREKIDFLNNSPKIIADINATRLLLEQLYSRFYNAQLLLNTAQNEEFCRVYLGQDGEAKKLEFDPFQDKEEGINLPHHNLVLNSKEQKLVDFVQKEIITAWPTVSRDFEAIWRYIGEVSKIIRHGVPNTDDHKNNGDGKANDGNNDQFQSSQLTPPPPIKLSYYDRMYLSDLTSRAKQANASKVSNDIALNADDKESINGQDTTDTTPEDTKLMDKNQQNSLMKDIDAVINTHFNSESSDNLELLISNIVAENDIIWPFFNPNMILFGNAFTPDQIAGLKFDLMQRYNDQLKLAALESGIIAKRLKAEKEEIEKRSQQQEHLWKQSSVNESHQPSQDNLTQSPSLDETDSNGQSIGQFNQPKNENDLTHAVWRLDLEPINTGYFTWIPLPPHANRYISPTPHYTPVTNNLLDFEGFVKPYVMEGTLKNNDSNWFFQTQSSKSNSNSWVNKSPNEDIPSNNTPTASQLQEHIVLSSTPPPPPPTTQSTLSYIASWFYPSSYFPSSSSSLQSSSDQSEQSSIHQNHQNNTIDNSNTSTNSSNQIAANIALLIQKSKNIDPKLQLLLDESDGSTDPLSLKRIESDVTDVVTLDELTDASFIYGLKLPEISVEEFYQRTNKKKAYYDKMELYHPHSKV